MGKPVILPSVAVNGRTVIVSNKWLRMASIKSEDWLEGEIVNDPELFVTSIKGAALGADIFTFAQKLPDTKPKYRYPMEWDNVAVIPITTYSDWWEKRLPQVSRKNMRRAAKRGVVARVIEFNDDLVRGIVEIHNDTPIRQGERFSHYGKDFAVVKQDYSSFVDRSVFIGVYFENELIGFTKIVFMGKIASILNILTKTAHYDKRPTNLLIAKAVEICVARGASHLIYGKYTYGNKTDSPLTEFKRRNGFEKIILPRYYIPLGLKGRMAVGLKLHRGLIGILPGGLIALLVNLRGKLYRNVIHPLRGAGKRADGGAEGKSQGDQGENDL